MLDVNGRTRTDAHGVQTVDAEKTALQTEIIGCQSALEWVP